MDRAEFLEIATPCVDGYVRAQEVDEHLGTIDTVTVSGGAGVGKDFIRAGTGYNRVIGWTTRDIRPGEVAGVDYRFVHSYYEEFLERLHNREAVQLAIGSDGVNMYGSFAEDYPANSRCIFDVIPRTAIEFRSIPFRTTTNFCITPDDYDRWQLQKADRGDGTDEDDRRKRLVEAHSSLSTCLEDDEFYFVINDGVSDRAVHIVKDVVELGVRDCDYERHARDVAGVILRRLEDTIETF